MFPVHLIPDLITEDLTSPSQSIEPMAPENQADRQRTSAHSRRINLSEAKCLKYFCQGDRHCGGRSGGAKEAKSITAVL